MKKLLSILTLTLSFTLLTGCGLTGEEIARLSINEISSDNENLIIKEVMLNLKKDEKIAIWSEMDIEYEGDISLLFRIEILKNGEEFGGLEIDPTDKNMTIGEMRTSFNGKTDWSFTGKNSSIKIEEDGDYTFKAILVASENPTLKVTKAELVLKK